MTNIERILSDFLNLFRNDFTIGEFRNINELSQNDNEYACLLLSDGKVEKFITNKARYSFMVHLVIYIQNIEDGQLFNRVENVLNRVLRVVNYEINQEFRSWCATYDIVNLGIPINWRTGQGVFLSRRQEMVVFQFVFLKN